MDKAMLDEVAEALERLADQPTWNLEVWRRCHDLVKANWDNELLEYVYDDIIHYDGLFHMRTILGWIFGFRTKPDRCQLEQYRQEFRDIASALRLGLSLKEAKRKYEL